MKERLPEDNKKTADWKDFLRVIAPQYINRNTEVIISEKEQTISFTIETAEIEACQKHFASVLRDSQSFSGQLSYFSRPSVSSIGSFASSVPKMPIIATIEDAKAMMEKLFGRDVMQGENPTNINFNTRFTHYENGVLLSEPRALSTRLGKMFSSEAPISQNFLCAYFHNVNIDRLRAVIAGDSQSLPSPSDEIMERERGEGFVQTCFGIVEIEDKNGERFIQMYFDIGRFLQLVYPPQLHCEGQDESKTRVTLSLSHLLLYVKQLSRHGLLFSVELEHGRVNAYPLLLPHKETIKRPLTVFIVLDDSGSMEEARTNVFESVELFIRRVSAVAPQAQINLTIFSGRDQHISRIKMAQHFNFDIFKMPSLNSKTALFDALSAPLSQMKKQLNSHNNLLLILTDGQDNESKKSEKAISKEISEIKRAVVDEGAPPPAIYALGCGKEVNKDVLNTLAQSAGHQEYIALKNADQFATIIHNIEQFEHRRVLTKFVTEINGKEEMHTIPVPLHGNPYVIREVTIPLSAKPVKVTFSTPTQGQELALEQVTLQITRTQAQGMMEDYAQGIESIYHNATLTPPFKISRLNELRGKIDILCSTYPQSAAWALAKEARQKIDAYTRELCSQHDAAEGSEKTVSPPSSSSLVSAIASLGNPAYSAPSASSKEPAELERSATLNL
ncbi:MAG: VWA domain-containing protein [Gammaproteobacteria bacterium]|nr:VWA domain-containing protein [Gammaproteobacteria bacterium]